MEQTKDLTIFRQARDAAQQRLEAVDEDIRKLENERLPLQATIASLDEILNDGEHTYSSAFATALEFVNASVSEAHNAIAEAILDPLQGLTESVRQIMAIVPNSGMQAGEIVKLMQERGFDVDRYTNPVSAVHTVLTRLCTKDEAKIIGRTPGGRPLYAPTTRTGGLKLPTDIGISQSHEVANEIASTRPRDRSGDRDTK